MHPAIVSLENGLRQFAADVDGPHDAASIDAAVSESLRRPSGLSSWAVWLFLGIMRRRKRATAILEKVRSGWPDHWPKQLTLLQTYDGAAIGLPGWRVTLGGTGCRLADPAGGESFLFDFDKDEEPYPWSADTFARYVGSLRRREYPERRMVELHRSIVSSQITEIRYTDDPQLVYDVLEPWLEVLNLPAAGGLAGIRLAAAVGDWQFLETAFPNGAESDEVRRRAAAEREERTRRSSDDFDSKLNPQAALWALDELRSPLLDDYLRRALADTPQAAPAALSIISRYDDDLWLGPVWEYFQRQTAKNRNAEESNACLQAADYLLRRGEHVAQVTDWLPNCADGETGGAALLALEFAPHASRDLFRRALQRFGNEQLTAAAVLAYLDEPWCHELLFEILKADEGGHHLVIYAAAQLSRSSDAAGWAAVWLRRHVDRRGYPSGGVADAALAYWRHRVTDQIDTLRDRLESIRSSRVRSIHWRPI